MTSPSPEALAAATRACLIARAKTRVDMTFWIGEIARHIDRHFASLRAERDALALRCTAMEKALKVEQQRA